MFRLILVDASVVNARDGSRRLSLGTLLISTNGLGRVEATRGTRAGLLETEIISTLMLDVRLDRKAGYYYVCKSKVLMHLLPWTS